MGCLSWLRGARRGANDGYQPLADDPAPERNCPEARAGLLSRIFFVFVTGLIKTGARKHLDPEDLWDLPKGDEAKHVYSAFLKHFEDTKADGTHPYGSLLGALTSAFKGPFLTAGLLKLCHDSVMFTGPMLLQQLLRSLDQGLGNWRWTLGLACAMLCASVIQTVCVNQYFHILFRVGLRVKVSTIHLVYAKLLRLSNAERSEMGAGQITNLQSNDTSKLYNIPQYLHMIWSGPMQIIVTMMLLIRVMKPWPALTGLGITIALIPINTVLGRALGKVRKELLTKTDARVKLCTEVITGIKAIKLYAWEEAYVQRISELRDMELKQIRKSALLSGLNMMVFVTGPILVSLGSFSVYSYMGYPLTADVAFTSLALFNLLRFPIMMFPMQIMNLINGAVALKRLQRFLEREEMECMPPALPATAGQAAVTVRDCKFAWSRAADATPALDLNLKVMAGELVMVVGEVGSGKSSLLAALLGEMVQVAGDVRVLGEIAYTSQDSWIQNVTLRDNILMGRPYDELYYNLTLEACALKSDLHQLAAGDQTEIGEKGINLSGGQRARVALARAVYARADVYLLDDPLSAVDAHVGSHLFKECVGGVLAKTTRVLVTHQLQFLPLADRVVVMRGGRISAEGTFEELQARGINFQQLTIQAQEGKEAPPAPEPEPQTTPLPTSVQGYSSVDAGDADEEEGSAGESSSQEQQPLVTNEAQGRRSTDRSKDQPSGRLVQVEGRAKGQVRGAVYMAYLTSWGPLLILPILYLLTQHIERGMQVGQNFWLSVWADATGRTGSETDNRYYMSIYFALGGGSLVFALVRCILIVFGANNAARALHRRLLSKIISLPMSFFDTQPTGRLLNRFTKDTEAVDVSLSSSVSSFTMCFVNVWMSLAVVALVTPAFVLGIIPLAVIYWRLQQIFIATSRELKRLDSVAASPIFSHFGETLSGLTTVRAFNRQDMFFDKNQELLDASNQCWWPIQVVNRWLSVRLELMGITVSFGTALLVAVVLPTQSGLAGLALTSALNLTGLMTWMVRQSTELEVNMNSVERMIEYEGVESEAPHVVEGHRPPAGWPSRGAITAEQLTVKYRADLPPVLKGISFSINAAEKVGIAGRTGCGKSTMMMTLYRLVEPCGGSLRIDGQDVLSMGLRDLRSRLALVPQDPVIFSGTIRTNLDPFDDYTDEQLWGTLSKVSMAEVVRQMGAGLTASVDEGGQNLSVGQRQLLGMARALLRNARILVLDEATSNVDNSTDLLIQKTLREAFADCTVLTIAHRLHTIMNSDRIMVLDSGNIMEFKPPAALLEDRSSYFSRLVEEATKQHAGMKQTKSQADMAAKLAAEAERVRRASLEAKK